MTLGITSIKQGSLQPAITVGGILVKVILSWKLLQFQISVTYLWALYQKKAKEDQKAR